MRKKTHSGGFTLLEMLVVITIIGILATLLLPGLATSLETARRLACSNNMRQMWMAMSMFSDENDGKFPAGHPNNFWGDPNYDQQRDDRLAFLQRRIKQDPTTFVGDEEDYPENMIRNNYIFDVSQVFPAYLGTMEVMICPSALLTRDLPRDEWFMDMTFSEEFIDPRLYDYRENDIVLNQLQGMRPDPECASNEFYTYLPYAIETEENALFLWDDINYQMYLGNTDFMSRQITIDPESFASRNSRREQTGQNPDDRFDNNANRSINIRNDNFGDRRGYEFDSRFGHAPGGGDTWFRTASGVGKQFIRSIDDPGSDYVSEDRIPVLFDSFGVDGLVRMNHLPLGGNVLYLDGHVEFQRYTTTTSQRLNTFGDWTFFSFGKLPYTTDFVDFVRANVYDNTTLMNIPPWCGNRDPDIGYMPRYWFYPDDRLYDVLHWDLQPTDVFADF